MPRSAVSVLDAEPATATRPAGHRQPTEWLLATVAAAVWGLVDLVVSLGGQRFSTEYLGYGWQLVPYEVLRADPIRSVWYLHIQPPLWNLLVGVVGRWSPLPDGISFQLVQAGFGMLAAALLTSLLRRLGCRAWLALLLGLAATLNPEFLRNAFEPTYELAVGCGLIALAWSLTLLDPGRRPRAGRALLAVSAVATAVVLTRSLYHPVWLVGVVGLAAWTSRDAIPWRPVAVAFAVPVVLVGGWMVKNEVLFGRATLSSWFGMNLQRSVIPVLPLDELQAMHDAGEVSDVAMIGPFGNYDLYRPVMPPCTPAHSHPALTTEVRDYPVVVPNLNYECFLPVYDQAGTDARAVIREHPGVWLDGRLWSARTWFAVSPLPDESPSWPLRQLGNVYQLVRLDLPGTLSTDGWGTPIYGQLTVHTRFSLTMVELTIVVAALGCVHTWRAWRRRDGLTATERTRQLVLAVVGMTVLWTFVAGVVGELGEQARFRTMTDPLVLAIGVAETVRWATGRFGGRDRCFERPQQSSEAAGQ